MLDCPQFFRRTIRFHARRQVARWKAITSNRRDQPALAFYRDIRNSGFDADTWIDVLPRQKLIYVSVPKEQRLCLPNTRFLLHQPSGGTRGMASDIEIQAREIIRMNERLNKIFAAATGQPVEKIAKDTDRDYWLSADEAKDYGLVSRIISSQSDI